MDGRASRDEWQKRVDRWKESGLTAKEFASETGINAGTLQFWRYKLKKRELKARSQRATGGETSILSSIVEVRPTVVAAAESRFEIELGNGRRVHVPSVFDAGALKALLAILDGTT
jgi:transposase-like protein